MTVQSIANRPTLGNSPSQQSLQQAWGNNGARNGETVVAIIDSGVDASHPDLAGSILETFSFTGGHGDSNGQGTHVAGIIAGKSNYGAETVSLPPSVKLSTPLGQPLQGSGFAAPVVTGLAATLAAANPNLTGEELKNKLMELDIPAYIGR